MFAIYDEATGQFFASTGWTRQPSSVYRYKTQEKAEEVLCRCDRPYAQVVPYGKAFEVLGVPGVPKKGLPNRDSEIV